jgi:hypothetical protein
MGIDLEKGFTKVWDPVRPCEDAGAMTAIKQSSIQLPAMAYAATSGALAWTILSLTASGDTAQIAQLRLLHLKYGQLATESLRKETERPGFQMTDVHICVILVLFGRQITPLGPEPFPQSPLAELQSCYLLSSFDPPPAQINALYEAVRARGGLDNLTMPYFRETLEL